MVWIFMFLVLLWVVVELWWSFLFYMLGILVLRRVFWIVVMLIVSGRIVCGCGLMIMVLFVVSEVNRLG